MGSHRLRVEARLVRCLLVLSWLLPVWGVHAQMVVTGRLLGFEGRPLPLAFVEVCRWEEAQLWAVGPCVGAEPVGRGGDYRVAIAEEGVYALVFHGALHDTRPVFVHHRGDRAVRLDVRLSPLRVDPDPSYARVVGTFNGFEYDTGIPLEAHPDGTYRARLLTSADTVFYDVPGLTTTGPSELVLEGMTADRFVPVRGKFLAAVAEPDGEVEFVVRMRAVQEPVAAEVAFGPDDGHAAAFDAFAARMRDYPTLAAERMQAARAAGRMDSFVAARRQEDAERLRAIEAEIERAGDAYARTLQYLLYLHWGGGGPFSAYRGEMREARGPFTAPVLDSTYLHHILRDVPPDDPAWAARAYGVRVLLEQLDLSPEAVAYAGDVAERHPSPTVRADVLFDLFEATFAREGRSEAAARYAARIAEEHPASPRTAAVRTLQEEAPALRPGRRAPALSSDAAAGFHPDSLDGKVVLLDFVAPACAACGTDASVLREALRRYGDRGLRVVRVALGGEPATAPGAEWFVLPAGGGFLDPLARSHGVQSVPYRVLVDGEGVVLAVGDVLAGDALMRQLEGVFGP